MGVDPTMALITLRNANWQNGVHVIVRKGNNYEPLQNPVIWDRRLEYQETWPIEAGDEDLYYIRDRDPDNPDGSMTDWTVVSSANGDQSIDI
jgi:hypothetical protein